MDNSLFFCNFEKDETNTEIIEKLNTYSDNKSIQMYLIDSPLGQSKQSQYDYKNAFVLLIPKHKICIINQLYENSDDFEDYCDDFIEDLGYLSDKYDYKQKLGRPRIWKDKYIDRKLMSEIDNVDSLVSSCKLSIAEDQRNADFLISLLIGSINDISRIGGDTPVTLLDQVKKKIILFDGDQSRFIYSQHTTQKRVTIQGLAGTGKTELLLHKLIDLYTREKETKIVFTCFNKILAQKMKTRIPEFFNFMRVDEQIKWNERLWVMSSWGSQGLSNTGVYSYICSNYNIQFRQYSNNNNFDYVCEVVIDELKNKNDKIVPCFDYIFIDESQDFSPNFFELCELITKRVVYIAGDIFQDIYDRNISQSISSDYLLNKCYRTDPKTLMFAHAVGMGLYEKPVIRWLTDEEWKSCGYNVKRDCGDFTLHRSPLRRFEDIDMANVQSINIINSSSEKMEDDIFTIIDTIRQNNPTVSPEDIAIVFLENDNKNYQLADSLVVNMFRHYHWNAIKGYELKDAPSNMVFISNRNNIKGLEFPFVICIVNDTVTHNVFRRNSIYMMLTRSFISSYMIINNDDGCNEEFIKTYTSAAKLISQQGYMNLREPPKDEQDRQNKKVSIDVKSKQMPISDIIDEVFKKYPTIQLSDRKEIKEKITEIVNKKGDFKEDEIISRTNMMIQAYL